MTCPPLMAVNRYQIADTKSRLVLSGDYKRSVIMENDTQYTSSYSCSTAFVAVSHFGLFLRLDNADDYGKWYAAICHHPSARRLSVCLSSVTFVCPTQAIEIFRNVSTPFGTMAICWHPGKILCRSSQGNLSVGRLNTRGVVEYRIVILETYRTLYLGNGARKKLS